MILVRLGIYAVVLVVVYFALAMTLSELSEVVVLTTSDGEEIHETRLWMVEGRSRRWLRAGSPTSSWLKRIYDEPHVEVEINGTTEQYTAAPLDDPELLEWVNSRMADKYGFADWLIGLTSNRAQSIPIRLDPP